MQALILNNKAGQLITTSLLVAEKFEKEHRHVLRDIESLDCSEEFRQSNFGLSSYLSQQNKELPMYEITKDGFSFLAMGYNGKDAAKFKEDYIKEFNKREALLLNDDYIITRAMEIQTKRMVALESALQVKEEQNKLLTHTIKEQAPKVEYVDQVLLSEDAINPTVIAKELGMSAIMLNKKLVEKRIIYKSGTTYVAYSKYQQEGFTKTRTHYFTRADGSQGTQIHTYFTEKGRAFIHSLFKKAA